MISSLGLPVSSQSEYCPDCGALVPVIPDGPVHRYFGASSGCWVLYAALLSREFSTFDARTHQLSVDTYAVQHPGTPSPQTTQSVCTHLVALCLSLEHEYGVEDIRPMMGDVSKGRFFTPVWLAAPAASVWPVTIVDLLDATSPEDYGAAVRQWAEATWQAWSAHHARVQAWSDGAIAAR